MYSSQTKFVDDADAEATSRSSKFDKFMLLMWKNYLLQWRHKAQMAIEVLVPVILCGILVIIRSMVGPVHFSEPMLFQPIRIDNIDELRYRRMSTVVNMLE